MRRLPAKFLNFWFNRCGLEFNSREIIENTKCPVLIVGRKGDTVIPQEIQLADKLSDQSTEGRLRRNRVLEHDPEIACENKNIHIDHEEHLVWKDGKKYESYIKIKSDFIELAYGYLVSNNFNGGYKPKQYEESPFSESLTEIELVPIKSNVVCATTSMS